MSTMKPALQVRSRVIVVGTYPPRRCGLATFTANTRRGLLAVSDYDVDVMRLGSDVADGSSAPEVVATWSKATSPQAAAECCDGYDCVLMQHEFGIFPGRDGEAVLEFIDHLRAPLVSVLHTVLVDPSSRQRRILEAVARRSTRLVVLTPSAAGRLVERYDVDRSLVAVIPHGAEPHLAPSTREPVSPPTLLTWGLLGPGKGIEHAIKAVAILAGRGLPVGYIVAGQTHPNVLATEGERYRVALQRLSAELGVDGLVQFDNQYRDWRSLHALVRTADVVVLPYDSREQVTSGVLVDALASGKPVVATAFPHALDVVDGRAGLVVPHEEPEAMADAIEQLLTDRRLAARCVAAARAEAALLSWPVVGRQYDQLLRDVVGASSALQA